jgi:carbamoyl-phosphate synthase large subunit
LLTELKIPFPQFGIAETADEASALADVLDFPLLIRPSYVLGQGMKIVINKQELEEHVVNLLKTIPGNKLLLDHYLDGAIEAEADARWGKCVYHRNYGTSNLAECTLEIVMRHCHRLI